jgi:predicted secreted Zn-dependent protease
MMTAADRSLVVEKELPHPPEKIWRALSYGWRKFIGGLEKVLAGLPS